MAKQKGIIKFKGTLNGLCYYKLNGVDVVRKATGPSKERIHNDPAFVRVKGNNQEFAAAVYLSKAIITGLGPLAKAFKDSYMQSRLTGVCRKIIQKGAGIQGQRDANLLNDSKKLIGFQLHKERPFNQIITEIPEVTINAERNMVTIVIQDAHKNLNKLTKNDRHFIFTAAVCLVSPFQWNKTLKIYKPLSSKQNGLGFTKESKAEPLNYKHHQGFKIQINTNMNPDSDVALIVWLGMSLVETIQDKQVVAQSPYGMQCIAVL